MEILAKRAFELLLHMKYNIFCRKMQYMQLRTFLFLIAIFLFVVPTKAHAYLDPGTGSYLLQVMLALFFGGVYAVSTWWRQIKTGISNLFSRKGKEASEKKSSKDK